MPLWCTEPRWRTEQPRASSPVSIVGDEDVNLQTWLPSAGQTRLLHPSVREGDYFGIQYGLDFETVTQSQFKETTGNHRYSFAMRFCAKMSHVWPWCMYSLFNSYSHNCHCFSLNGLKWAKAEIVRLKEYAVKSKYIYRSLISRLNTKNIKQCIARSSVWIKIYHFFQQNLNIVSEAKKIQRTFQHHGHRRPPR